MTTPTTPGKAPARPPVEPTVEPTSRWIRVKFGGEIIADSKNALLLIQYGPGLLPTYYFSPADVRMDLLESGSTQNPATGLAYQTVKVGDRTAENAAWIYQEPPARLEALKGFVSFEWGKQLTWLEEDEEVFVHARDPHKRVDVLASSRHVQVVIKGETVADTQRPFLLFETFLPTRYYIPRQDVNMNLLAPENLTTRCPYKGIANYWSVQVGDHKVKNVVWSYADPIPENPKIKGLVSFFNERVDLYVDGELQMRPITPWSE